MTAIPLHHHLCHFAGTQPDAAAVVYGDDRISYGELEERSSRLARALSAAGCAPGDRVCLALPKDIDAIVSILAVLKAGCIYVPLDMKSPAARLARIIDSCEPSAVLAASDTRKTLDAIVADHGVSIPALGLVDSDDRDGAALKPRFTCSEIESEPASSFDAGSSVDGTAYILFTSGSTGFPKGVPITHRNVSLFVEWANGYFKVGPDDRMSGHTALHFDLSAYDLYGTLFAGAQLHLVPPEASILPNKTSEFIRSSRLTQWFTVPSVLKYMHKFDVIEDNDYPDLRRVIWCGEVFPTANLIHWMRKLPHVQFTNLYGPTEATIASSYYTVSAIPASDTEPVPIGRACEGESLHVFGPGLEELPVGEVGDLFIGGAGLSAGYWQDEKKTAEAFIDAPAGSGLGRIYRTGDLAYRDEDGLFHFVGRADTQIKSRGYRIELGEIETALATIDDLVESAVVAVETGDFEGVAICCAYAPSEGQEMSSFALKKKLQSLVPDYMLPTRWTSLGVLPKTTNGKIDRLAVKDLFSCGDAADKAGAGRREGSA